MIQINRRDFDSLLTELQDLPADVLDSALDYFVKQTPVQGGNARRNTKLDQRAGTILADYPYAARLDTGYSKQAPRGMTEPTARYLVRAIQQAIRSA
jgi:hypothetical protein